MGPEMTALEEAQSRPYVPGQNDCFMMALSHMDNQLGTSYLDQYRGAYSTIIGANRALIKRGFRSLGDFIATLVPSQSVMNSRVGDIGIVRDGIGDHLCILCGTSWVTITDNGSKSYPLLSAHQSFKVRP